MLKLIHHLTAFFSKLFYFGPKIAFWFLLDYHKRFFKLNSKRVSEKMHTVILNWLNNSFKGFISNYNINHDSNNTNFIPRQIWICWWDGTEAMPPLVKACYNSVILHSGEFTVTLITKFNYQEYISLPDYIIKKFNQKKIAIAHLSDIIRMALLSKYGGLWLDATILVTKTISISNSLFFTVKREYGSENVAGRRWTGNCIGGAPNLFLFRFLLDFFYEYWKKQNKQITYLLIDYSIALAYNIFSEVRNIIDGILPNNTDYMRLCYYLDDEYNSQFFNEIHTDTFFHKLSWKESHHSFTLDNKITFYGHILKE